MNLLLAAAIVLSACTSNAGSVRIMTLNVKGTQDVAAVADLVRANNVDVLLMQEVTLEPGTSWLDELGTQLGWATYFGIMQVWQGEEWGYPEGTYLAGLAIAAPRLAQARTIHYQTHGDYRGYWDDLRGMVIADTNAGHIGTTHWSVDKQAHANYQLRAYGEMGAGPWILGGDFNESPLMHAHSGGHTFPANNPRRTIDWFQSRGVRVISVTVVQSKISDHLPVIIEVAR